MKSKKLKTYRDWIRSNPTATKEIYDIIEQSKAIKNEKYRRKFLKNEKHDFETKWTQKYCEYRKKMNSINNHKKK